MSTDGSEEVPVIAFSAGSARLAVEAARVQGLLALQAPTPIPQTPPYVLGLVSHGERALVLLDLATLLHLDGAPEADPSLRRVLVVSAAGMRVGLVCDRTGGILSVPPEALAAGETDAPEGKIRILDLPSLLETARIRP